MAPKLQDKCFSPEAESSIITLSQITDRMRKAYYRSGAAPADIHALFSSDDILLFRSSLVTLFAEMDLSYVLVESGIPVGNSFMDETSRIIKGHILPYVYDECDLRLVVRKIFTHKKDAAMLQALSEAYAAQWLESDSALLRDFISTNIQLIAYRITENKRKTGEHYVTSGRSEYWDMFMSAAGGGFIISFMVIIKLMLHHAELPPLWEGIAFSLNYAIGFVLIHVLGFTVATKQPAMTAAYIAASLDEARSDDDSYHDFAVMIAAVSRSQLASFAGNLLAVFPFTMIWILFVQAIWGDYFLSETTAKGLLDSVNPFSLAIVFAAIAGFYLFLAGLISGFGDNKVVVSHIGLRLMHHPWLSRHISPARLTRIVGYTERNLGPILGNAAVGILLGMTGFFGHITGLPLDIRHITFSTGNIAVGLFGVGFHVTAMDVCAMLTGIFLLGLVNFLVSFSFALQVAIRSRGLRLRNYPDLAKSVLRYFWKHPSDFFWPGKEVKQEEQVAAPAE
jgi:site-specific recombinase